MIIKDLEDIRNKIDDNDREIITLLKKRQDLVKQAAVAKKNLGLSAYSQDREAYVLSHCEELALENELPKGFLKDVMKRVLRESYKLCSGTDFNFPRMLKEDGDVVIVGGNGGMGRIFANYFENSGYKVFSFGHRGWDKAPEYLKSAKIVIVSVPIDITIDIIKKLSPMLREDQILCDFTSVKAPIVEAMMKYHKGPVLGLHPMFGPDVKSLVKQVVVTVPERDEKASEFLVEQLRIWGATICKCSAKEHDDAMAIIQALRHFSTYSYGTFLQKLAPDLEKLKSLSSPIYRLELMMVGRLFAQDPRLYADIIMSSKHNSDLIENFVNSIKAELEVVKNADVDTFTERFLKTRDFFGKFAEESLAESGSILAKLQDERK
ncbi:MAG: bifunctional chorismate mutase/prephenate dehydrogenase [Aeromonadales bacterium]|nr:bifunctional chorismate mutase/prephenate dehydrogenase [Aeromonadales bacterium]